MLLPNAEAALMRPLLRGGSGYGEMEEGSVRGLPRCPSELVGVDDGAGELQRRFLRRVVANAALE